MSHNKKTYTINIYTGNEVLLDIIDSLAKQVICKSIDDLNTGNLHKKNTSQTDDQFNLSCSTGSK